MPNIGFNLGFLNVQTQLNLITFFSFDINLYNYNMIISALITHPTYSRQNNRKLYFVKHVLNFKSFFIYIEN